MNKSSTIEKDLHLFKSIKLDVKRKIKNETLKQKNKNDNNDKNNINDTNNINDINDTNNINDINDINNINDINDINNINDNQTFKNEIIKNNLMSLNISIPKNNSKIYFDGIFNLKSPKICHTVSEFYN
jgi:hypothetical protein